MLDGLISAGANLLGGWMKSNTADEDRRAQQAMAAQNIAAQREFAQHGIRWKVEDAKAAGLHPLAALGAQTSSFSPVSIGSSGDGGAADSFAAAGQDIGRAVKAAITKEEREERDANLARKLELEKGSLQNDLLRTELVSKIRREAVGVGPPFPGGVPMPRPGPRRMPSGEAVKEDDLKATIEDNPSPESGRPFGFQMQYNPLFGSGQAFEDRYGDSEIAQTLKFIANLGGDVYSTAKHWLGPFPRTRPSDGRSRSAERRFKSRPWGE